MDQVREGDVVRIHYTGRLEDGTIFDSSDGGEPMAFIAAGEDLIEGVSKAVVGMKAGEKKTVTIPPELGYGFRDPELENTVKRTMLPPEVKVGDMLSASTGDHEFTVTVLSMDENEAMIDSNHPLAGKTLVFDIEVVEIGGELPEPCCCNHHGDHEGCR
ncbi:MAG: peptidylprolyl isomerase [Deltaproteobacteria bacterium]|nr:peptidylprolyl isomerase [Deltaproteobacteria bacterium]